MKIKDTMEPSDQVDSDAACRNEEDWRGAP